MPEGVSAPLDFPKDCLGVHSALRDIRRPDDVHDASKIHYDL